MDTTITISSTTAADESDFLQLTYNAGIAKDAMISVDASGFRRVPVTWDKSALLTCQTKPSISSIQNHRMQVKEKGVEDGIMKDIKNIAMQNYHYPTPFNSDSLENKDSDSKSLILVRCDFNKSTNIQPYYPTLNPFNRSTSLIKYFKEEQSAVVPNISSSSLSSKKSENMDIVHNNKITEQQSKSSESVINSNQNLTSVDTCSSDNEENMKSDGEFPLSPESRKKELCNYLKLMNPADKKEILKLQNRRSTRVRNLTTRQEQKELKRSAVRQNGVSEKAAPRATLKSFKELNIRVAKCGVIEEQTNDIEKSFCFPLPPKQLVQKVNDFDIVMASLVPVLKKMCKKRNIKCNRFGKNQVAENSVVKHISGDDEMKLLNDSKTEKDSAKYKKVSLKNEMIIERNHVVKKNNLERINSLRSKGKLKGMSLKKLIIKKDKDTVKWKALKQKELRQQNKTSKSEEICKTPCSLKSSKNSDEKSTSSKCEISSVAHLTEDTIDLENFMDDMVDFDNLSEEHRKCLIKNRILSTKPMRKSEGNNDQCFSSLQTLSPLYGFHKTDEKRNTKKSFEKGTSQSEAQKKEKKEMELLKNTDGYSEKTRNKNEEIVPSPIIGGNTYLILNIHGPDIQVPKNSSKVPLKEPLLSTGTVQDHDYADAPSGNLDESNTDLDVVTIPMKNLPVGKYLEINTKHITKDNEYQLLPYNKSVEMKSLHKSLQFNKKKKSNITMDANICQEWVSDRSPKRKSRKSSHSISISRENGAVIKAFYVDHNLIICQEYLISFWMQTPLGNVLGSQDMWVPRGQTQRIVLNNKCVQKESMERVICTETSVVYVELWMKEHKSEMRQGPVADVFVTLYFWKQRQSGLDKKVLQLENINGFADDVQYSVMKGAPKIIVSWHRTNEDNLGKRTFIHAYLLAADYQTVSNIFDIEPVDHYVSSLHNIEDCENLIMGCGENKITLWNIEFGQIIATVELTDIKSPLSTLWVKCDRGFLFALQQCVDRELRLIAINGINHSWKKLASYFPPEGFDRLRGVCVENGLLLSFYDQGILCWKAETGEPVEEISSETDVIPSGKHVILVEDNQVIVKHVMTHLFSMSVEES